MKKCLTFIILFSLLIFKTSAQVILHKNTSNKLRLDQKVTNNFLDLNAERKIVKVVMYNRKSEETYVHNNSEKDISIDLNNYGASPYTIMVHTSHGDIVLLGIEIIKKSFVERPPEEDAVIAKTETTKPTKKADALAKKEIADKAEKKAAALAIAEKEAIDKAEKKATALAITEKKAADKAAKKAKALIAEKEAEDKAEAKAIAQAAIRKERNAKRAAKKERAKKLAESSSDKVIAKKEVIEEESTKGSAKIVRKEKYTRDIEVISHWIIKETSKSLGSSFTARFIHNKKQLDVMIEKNRLDNKSAQGKSNGLTVYQVYDLATFSHNLKKELSKKVSVEELNTNATELKSFNAIPIYNTRF